MSRRKTMLKHAIIQAAVSYGHDGKETQNIGADEAANKIRPKSAGEKFYKRSTKAVSELVNNRRLNQ